MDQYELAALKEYWRAIADDLQTGRQVWVSVKACKRTVQLIEDLERGQ